MADKRRRGIYLLVLIVMGLFAHSVGGYVPFFLFAFALSLYLGAAVWMVLGSQGVALIDEVDFDERAMVGQDYPLRLTIKNVSMITWPWLIATVRGASGVEIAQPHSHCGVVRPRESKRLQVRVRFTRRGRYDRFWVQLILRDLLGLFDQDWAVERGMNLVVLPHILTIGSRLDGSGYALGVADRDRQLSEDVDQPIGLRPYIHGDSIRRVHWRTTAKTGQLMVKTYAHQSRAQVYIYLDCCAGRQAGEGDHSSFERAVVAAASLANHLLARRVAVGLVAAGAPAPFYAARDHLSQQAHLLDALALVESVQSDGTLDRVTLELNPVPAGSLVIVISTMTSDALRGLLLKLQLRQIHAAMVQFELEGSATVEGREQALRHPDARVPWVYVRTDDDLVQALEEVTYALLG
ncbi:MAG: DUF58 domain-containing protein [Bacillota bacterium]